MRQPFHHPTPPTGAEVEFEYWWHLEASDLYWLRDDPNAALVKDLCRQAFVCRQANPHDYEDGYADGLAHAKEEQDA